MHFEPDHLYHIYNQGNNRRKIFIEKRNYAFFLEKIRTYISPYADVLAYCLMSNHFHLMVRVNKVELALPEASHGVTQSHSVTEAEKRKRSLNDSIAIMLRSYTRAINKQEGWSGSLFREGTKAQCLTSQSEYRKPYFSSNGITHIQLTGYSSQYPQYCFDYIHNNPVVAGLVKHAVAYPYSSAKAYTNPDTASLINRDVAAEYVHIKKPPS